MSKADEFDSVRQKLGGVSRRDFLKFCSVMAVGMGLPLSAGARIAEAIINPKRPPVIWLSFQECTGCVESLLRSTHPTATASLILLLSNRPRSHDPPPISLSVPPTRPPLRSTCPAAPTRPPILKHSMVRTNQPPRTAPKPSTDKGKRNLRFRFRTVGTNQGGKLQRFIEPKPAPALHFRGTNPPENFSHQNNVFDHLAETRPISPSSPKIICIAGRTAAAFFLFPRPPSKGLRRTNTPANRSTSACRYRSVVAIDRCRNIICTVRISTPSPSK